MPKTGSRCRWLGMQTYIFHMAATDDSFWQQQPALAWIAAGSHGKPRTSIQDSQGQEGRNEGMEGKDKEMEVAMEANHKRKVVQTKIERAMGTGRQSSSTTDGTTEMALVLVCRLVTYETVEGEEEEKKEEDEEDPEEEKDPLRSSTLEEFYGKRVFTFIHHFAGNRDPLSKALILEAIRQGIKFKVISYQCGEVEGYTWEARSHIQVI